MSVAYKETVQGTPYIKVALSLEDVEALVMFIWQSEISDRTLSVDHLATTLNECYAAHVGSDVTDDFEWKHGEYADDEEEEEEEEDEEEDDEEEGEETPADDGHDQEDPEYEYGEIELDRDLRAGGGDTFPRDGLGVRRPDYPPKVW